MKRLSACVAVAAVVAGAGAASAKEIRPGDLRVCGVSRCRVVAQAAQARAFFELFWGTGRVRRAPTPRVGAPVFQLRTRTGPAGALLTASSIRVHGLNCGRFERGRWYRLPVRLRGLTKGLAPKRLSATVPRSC